MNEKLISAISTPSGTGGVAIIRVSGEGALELAAKMFAPAGNMCVSDFQPNRMYTGKILCDGFYDFGMCVFFKAPKSFTGEDVVEFHCHGGAELARGVLKATFNAGARAAERGEFTKRAFLNGKLSLSAAEGMADMINAESLAQVRAGFSLYTESLTNEGRLLQALLTECLASIDAEVDYPEEDLQADTAAEQQDGGRPHQTGRKDGGPGAKGDGQGQKIPGIKGVVSQKEGQADPAPVKDHQEGVQGAEGGLVHCNDINTVG